MNCTWSAICVRLLGCSIYSGPSASPSLGGTSKASLWSSSPVSAPDDLATRNQQLIAALRAEVADYHRHNDLDDVDRAAEDAYFLDDADGRRRDARADHTAHHRHDDIELDEFDEHCDLGSRLSY